MPPEAPITTMTLSDGNVGLKLSALPTSFDHLETGVRMLEESYTCWSEKLPHGIETSQLHTV